MSTDTDLVRLLGRVAEALAAHAGEIESLGELAAGGPLPDEALQLRAQSIDRLAQEVGELATLLAAVSGEVPALAVPGRLIDAVRLSDLAARLRGDGAPAAAAAGHLDLF